MVAHGTRDRPFWSSQSHPTWEPGGVADMGIADPDSPLLVACGPWPKGARRGRPSPTSSASERELEFSVVPLSFRYFRAPAARSIGCPLPDASACGASQGQCAHLEAVYLHIGIKVDIRAAAATPLDAANPSNPPAKALLSAWHAPTAVPSRCLCTAVVVRAVRPADQEPNCQ